MKQSAENELNALSSWLLGITGVSLILIPFHFGMEKLGTPPWAPLVLGIFCYLTALSNQLMFVMKYSRNRVLFQQSMSILLLFALTLFMVGTGYFIEGSILGYFAVGQLIINSPLKKHFEHTDLLQLIFVLAGLSSGIYLAISGNQYDRLNGGPIRNILAVLFLAASIVEIARRVFFRGKLGSNYSRLQVIPWVAWCLFFLPTLSVAHLIAPGLLAAGILFNQLFPWNRLQLPENDMLGNRAVKITSTLETTLLIFLSALLIMMDFRLKVEGSSLFAARNAAFMFFILSSTVLYYEAITIIMTINSLISELARTGEEIAPPADPNLEAWNTRLTRYIRPFTRARELSQTHLINAQNDQINILARQLTNEKKRNSQITMLMELSQQLENQLDQPVAAQLAVNSLERALNCELICLFIHESDQRNSCCLPRQGNKPTLSPSGFRQSISTGILGRAVRQRKTQIIQDTRKDADYIPFEGLHNLSAVVIPLIFNGYVNGAITLDSERPNAFNSTDVWLAKPLRRN